MRLRRGAVELRLDLGLYGERTLRAAALALGDRARAYISATRTDRVVVLKAARPAGALRALAGEFLEEALSHLYRQRVAALNKAASGALLARLFDRGLAPAPPDPLEEMEPQVAEDRRRETEDLRRAAEQTP